MATAVATALPPDLQPARLLPRYVAWSLDAACLLPLLALLAWPPLQRAAGIARDAVASLHAGLGPLLERAIVQGQSPLAAATAAAGDPTLLAAVARLNGALATLLLTPVAFYALLALGWALLFETSRAAATPGKRAMRLRVLDASGRGLSWRGVAVRHLAAGASWLTLNLGHAMIAVPAHLALHDRLSGTRVLAHGRDVPLPAWARAWLALQVLTAMAGLAWIYAWSQALMWQALGL